MIALGISPLDKDSTVSILQNGKVLYAAAEERFSRKKLQEGFPLQALMAGLEHTGLAPGDIDVVAYSFFDWEKETALFTQNMQNEQAFLDNSPKGDTAKKIQDALKRVPQRSQNIPGLGQANEKMEKQPLYKLFYRLAGSEGVVSRNIAKRGSADWQKSSSQYHKAWQEELETNLQELNLLQKLSRYDHHLAHAANAFFASGFDPALIVTLDGYGSGLAGSVSIGKGNKIDRLHGLEYPHSLGTFYESVTSSLGFKPSRHEGKIVGLAAYGDPEILLDVLLDRFEQQAGRFKIIEPNNIYFSRHLSTLFPKMDVAAVYQRVLEIVATNYIRHYVEHTGIDTVVLSGGVTANVKLNQRIFEIPGVKKIFIYPNMGDGGCGTGAAMLASLDFMNDRKAYETTYFGQEYNDAEIASQLQAANLSADKLTDIEKRVAELIHEGKVVARFDGRMEYGPRALGNRSILYHAAEPSVNQWLNQRLGRTEFMPFAPATLFEERRKCYQNIDGAELSAQFMTITFDCTDFMKRTCPAAVHVDGTARPQLVKASANPGFYRIIKEYANLSGVPSIINTSFNMHEEPIVKTPEDAICEFLQGNLDYLAIGDFLVRHPGKLDV
ncbi:MAG: carbamoyltransferase, partial [Calditrichaeota bacterium]|nr:carbamoyltransferase [Calditrichota bacterium]